MSNPPKLDISAINLDDLLSGLADRVVSPHPIDMWIESENVHPGTTRTPASHLYQQYCAFRADNPGIPGVVEAIRVWGKFMSGKFKSGHGRHGTFYYISREREVEVPYSLLGRGK